MVQPLADFFHRAQQVRSTIAGEPRRVSLYDSTIARIDPQSVRNFQDKYQARLASYGPDALEKYADIPHWIADKTRIAILFDLDRCARSAILDIGSGGGHFLAICSTAGHRTLGLDIEEPFYTDLSAIVRIDRRIVRVERQKVLPDLGERFDLITIILQKFDHLATHTDGSRDYWSIGDWVFFLRDLMNNQLNSGGRIYLELNKEKQKDKSAFAPHLLQWCRSNGAIVNCETGIIEIFHRPY